ncbi:MAG: hypothetical protein U5L45_16520 [Saprospiraceae bacterium]|nr:hypothetical protein [Saprospiraceae bacterium]
MAKSKLVSIPNDIKHEVLEIVEGFNQKSKTYYRADFRGKFCYISRIDKNDKAPLFIKAVKLFLPTDNAPELETKIGRLTWTGDMDSWDFAVYKYSRDSYDPDEWFFPGREKLNGTVQSVLETGYTIYPK